MRGNEGVDRVEGTVYPTYAPVAEVSDEVTMPVVGYDPVQEYLQELRVSAKFVLAILDKRCQLL